MKGLPYKNIISQSKYISLSERSVLVVRNIPLEPIFSDYLHYFAISSFPSFCDEKEALLEQRQFDFALIMLDLPTLREDFYDHFYQKASEDLQSEKQFIDDFLNRLFVHMNKICQHVIFFSFLPDPIIGQSKWNSFVFSINQQIKKQIENRCLYIDLWELLMANGWETLINSRNNRILKSRYQPLFFEEVARIIKKTLVPAEKQIKCLVLDCDGVLWGGVLSEDGIDGICLQKEGPGKYFRLFQREIQRLINNGIIVTLCSKNDQEAVVRVFKEHPEMLLKWADITDSQINWKDKAQNIQTLANRLNLRLEQMLFIDDDPHEISLVNQILPQVQTLLLDPAQSEQYIYQLYSFYFPIESRSAEDSIRTMSYQQNLQRNEQIKDFSSAEEFNSFYHTICDIRLIYKTDFERVVQLSQRSNQFNLSLTRFSFPQLERLLQDDSYDILCMQVKDDFGDLGLIAISSIHYVQQSACIESFIFSCRALGRNLENRFMNDILSRVRRKKVRDVTALVRRTKKNEKNIDFYKQFSIKTIEEI